jgi:ADP-ribose pyrophosphatase YjhB (NUDIX family)
MPGRYTPFAIGNAGVDIGSNFMFATVEPPLAAPLCLTQTDGSEESSPQATTVDDGGGTRRFECPAMEASFDKAYNYVAALWEDFSFKDTADSVRTSVQGSTRRSCLAWHQTLVNITSPGTYLIESHESLESLVPDAGDQVGVEKECTWKIWYYARDGFLRLRLGTIPPAHTIQTPRGYNLVIPYDWVRPRSWFVDARDFSAYFSAGYSVGRFFPAFTNGLAFTHAPHFAFSLLFAGGCVAFAYKYRSYFSPTIRFLYDDTVRAEAQCFINKAQVERSTDARANIPAPVRLEDFVKDRYPVTDDFLVEHQTYMCAMGGLVAYGIAVPGALTPLRKYEYLGTNALRHLEQQLLIRDLSSSNSSEDSEEEKPIQDATTMIVYDDQNRILCGNEPEGKERQGMMTPMGGKVNDGEAMMPAGIRECEEEASVSPSIDHVLVYKTFRFRHYRVTQFRVHTKHTHAVGPHPDNLINLRFRTCAEVQAEPSISQSFKELIENGAFKPDIFTALLRTPTTTVAGVRMYSPEVVRRHQPEPILDLTVRPRDFKIDQGTLKPLRLGVTIFDGGLFDEEKEQDPLTSIAGGVRLPQLCKTAGPMAQNRWNELCGVTRHLQAVPEWDSIDPAYMKRLDDAGDLIAEHLLEGLKGRMHEINDRTRTPITWGADFRERMENEATSTPRPFLGGHNKPLEAALVDLEAGDPDKLPRLIGDAKPPNASKAAEYVQPLEAAVKLVMSEFTFKGHTMEETDAEVTKLLRDCEEGILLCSIDFGAFDSTKTPNDKRWERSLMIRVVCMFADSWHKLVDSAVLEQMCEEERLFWKLRFITVLMESCDYILFSGQRCTSVGNVLTVLRHFVAEIIRVYGIAEAKAFLKGTSKMKSKGDGDDLLAKILASMYRTKDNATLEEMAAEMVKQLAKYGKKLEVTISKPEHGCEVLSRFHVCNKDSELHFPKPRRLFQRLEYYLASDLNYVELTDGKRHVVRDRLFHERCATSLLSGLRNCVQLKPVAFYMIAGVKHHLSKLSANAVVNVDNRLRLRAEEGLVDIGFRVDATLASILEDLETQVHAFEYTKWHWVALVKMTNFGKQLEPKAFADQLKAWQGFTDRIAAIEIHDEDFQHPELVVNRIDFPPVVKRVLGVAEKLGTDHASDVRALSTRDQQTAAFRAAATVGTSGGPGSKDKGSAKGTNSESPKKGAPAKSSVSQTGKKGEPKAKAKPKAKVVFSSRARGQQQGGGNP